MPAPFVLSGAGWVRQLQRGAAMTEAMWTTELRLSGSGPLQKEAAAPGLTPRSGVLGAAAGK